MNKVLDFITSIGINMFIFGLWAYKMLVTSDIPAEISYSEALSISFLLILFLIIYSFYVRSTKYKSINILLLLLPLFLWSMSMQQALIYHYQRYDTLVSIIGFVISMIAFIEIIYTKLKNRD